MYLTIIDKMVNIWLIENDRKIKWLQYFKNYNKQILACTVSRFPFFTFLNLINSQALVAPLTIILSMEKFIRCIKNIFLNKNEKNIIYKCHPEKSTKYKYNYKLSSYLALHFRDKCCLRLVFPPQYKGRSFKAHKALEKWHWKLYGNMSFLKRCPF